MQPSATGIDFAWQLTAEQVVQNEGAVQIKLAGFTQADGAGELRLPEQSQLVVLPPAAVPQLRITHTAIEPLALAAPVARAPIPFGVKKDPAGRVIAGDYRPAADDEPLPTQPMIEFEEIGRMGGVRLGRVTFRPVVYDPATQTADLVTALNVTLEYGTAVSPNVGRHAQRLTSIEQMLHAQVINPDLLGNSGIAVQSRTHTTSAPQPNLIIEVTQAGLHTISYADLLAADSGAAALPPTNWQLARQGEPVDMLWIGDHDNRFETGERFLFVAPPAANRWSTSEFYTLTAGDGAGSRIETATPPAVEPPTGTLTLSRLHEQDKSYTPNCFCGHLPAGRDGDRWVWDELRVPGNPTGSYPLDLAGADISAAHPAELTLWLIGFTDLPKVGDHKLDIVLDGAPLDSVVWDGKHGITHTVSIPAGRLTPTSQLTLTLDTAANSIDGVWLDAFEVTYTKAGTQATTADGHWFAGEPTAKQYPLTLSQTGWAFDVTDQNKPKLIGTGTAFVLQDIADGGRRYFAADEGAIQPAVLRTATAFQPPAATLLMIGPAEFEAALTPLVELRQSQGWSVEFISLAEIYDSYGYGYPSPFAIQAALKDVYTSAAVRPEAVILVGDGTHDPKKNQANGKETFVPVMFADVDPWIGEIPADNRYVTVDGDDVLPDMLLGRLPVNTIDELNIVVGKLVAYPEQNFSWRKNVTFVADNNDKAGAFSTFVSTQFSRLNGGNFNLSSVQYGDSPESLIETRTKIGEAFSRGNSHLVYVGHSTVHQWADENLMHISQVDRLRNRTRLPIVLQLTCFTGSFHMTGLDALDEALLRHPSGGAVGVWGATGLSVTTGHDALAEGYFSTLASGNNTAVGEAIVAGKIKMMTDKPRHADLIDAYTFFGDPTLILAEPTDVEEGYDIYLPLIQR